MGFALAFALVYVYGAGLSMPILFMCLTVTKPFSTWQRLGVSFLGSLAWPVMAVAWFVADE